MGSGWDCPLEIAGKPSAEKHSAVFRLSGDRFFETMGIRLVRGRTISEEDFVHARKVVVINRAFLSKYFETEDPLGQQIKVNPSRFGWGIDTIQQQWFEIVGVVADTRHMGSPAGPTMQPTVFVPYTVGGISYSALVVRTTAEPTGWLNSVRQESAAIDKELPVLAGSLRDELEFSWFTEPRFVLTMLVAFASLGIVLVSVGVYSILSYAVSRRTQEIGIRMAMGAEATDVRWMVMMSGLRWLLVGIGIGVPASIALAKVLQNRIWGIKSADPLTLIAVSLLLTAVGLAACYFPARRATKVDPIVALRYE
jgi:putative ABC transport system permease protein